MSLFSKFMRGGLQLTAGFAGQQALVFLRNVLIAGLIGPENFGIAVTYMIVMSALEVISDLGVEHYLIRSKDSEDETVMKTLHLVLILRGFLIGAIIFCSADLIAWLFGLSDLPWVYRILALVPVIKGFMHLDMRRLQRQMIYLPSVSTTLAGTAVGTVIALVSAQIEADYTAMIWAYIGEGLTILAMTHLVARTPYRVGLDRPTFSALIGYGWPLLANGIILFLMNQGDRMIVGAQMGVRELANYAVASILTAGPALVVLKVAGALFMPMLSTSQTSPAVYTRRYELCGTMTALVAIYTMSAFVFLGVPVTELLYGSDYDVPVTVMAWLAAASGARILRSWPLAAALATGRTRDILHSNLLRVVAFGGAVLAVTWGFGAPGVAISVAVGELISLIYVLERSDRHPSLERKSGRMLYLSFIACFSVSLVAVEYLVPPSFSAVTLSTAVAIQLVATLAALVLVEPLRAIVLQTISQAAHHARRPFS